MNFQIQAPIAPPGEHRVAFVRCEEVKEGKYGRPALRWIFQVQDGPYRGHELIRVTGYDPRLGTSLGELLQSLYGSELKEGETVDPVNDLRGQLFEVFAIPGEGGGGLLQTIRPVTLSDDQPTVF